MLPSKVCDKYTKIHSEKFDQPFDQEGVIAVEGGTRYFKVAERIAKTTITQASETSFTEQLQEASEMKTICFILLPL